MAQWESRQTQDPQVLERALESAQKAVALNDAFPWVHNLLAKIYLRKMQYEQAIAEAKRAIALDPNNVEHSALLTASYLAQWESLQTQDRKMLERALEGAQKMIALSESQPWAHSLLARVYLWKKQHAQAIAEAERTIALDPNNADHYAVLSYILSYAGQPEKALTMVEQAVRQQAQPPGWYFAGLGFAYSSLRRDEEAIAAYEKALAVDPSFLQSHLALAFLYSEVAREAEARAELTTYQTQNPKVSLAFLQQVIPYKDPANVDRMLANLRKAGLK